MRFGFEAEDISVSEEVHQAVGQRLASSVFSGVQDLRLRLRRTKDALLCVAMVGFASGELVTVTATSHSPLTAVVDALDGLPQRIDRVRRTDRGTSHAAVREALKRQLARAGV